MNTLRKISYISIAMWLMLISAYAQQSLLLQNATIFDGAANKTPYKGSIWITNGEIRKIFQGTVNVPKGTEVIDCHSKFIVPGLIESHIHLATIDLTDTIAAKDHTDKILHNMVRHGITTVRDMTGYAPYLAYYQRESEVGHKIAPSIFYAAQFAGPGYFKMFENQSSKPMGVSPWERAITDTTDIEKAVKEAKEIGATGIKTYAELSESQFSTIVKAAKKNGLLVWSHATIFPIQPSDIAKYKIQSLSHAADVLFEQLPKDSVDLSYAWQRVYQGMKPDQEVLQSLFSQMKTNHIFFDPTVFHATNNRLNYSTDIVRWAHQAGVKIVAGTDWIYSEDKDEMVPLYDEVWLYMEKSGLSALEAIETLTSHGATVIGLNDRGLIRKGKRADILILDQNPLSDIRALFEPNTVIKKGNIIFDRDK